MAASPPLDRRQFLQQSVRVGAWAAGTLAAGALLEGCGSTPGTPGTTSSSPTVASSPATASTWAALGAALTGRLVVPTSPSYPNDRLLYNSKFTDLHPRAIAYCASATDVARCIDFANSHAVAVAARSGGHSYGGYSTTRGLVIDVSPLAAVVVDPRSNSATVGAGAQLIDVYNSVGRAGRLLPGGSCPSVGIAGLALGGGIGVFGRQYGLTTDNLRALTLITADGELVTANASEHADLWWASRGGGGGNFGVATSFEFDVHPMPPVTLFTRQYPWEAATNVLASWQRWIGSAPDQLWSNCLLLSQGSYGFLAQISGVLCGSPAELASLLAPLTSDIATKPSYSFVGAEDYLSAMEIEAGCSGLSVASCHLSTERAGGRLSRSASAAKSSYVDEPLSGAKVETMVEAVTNLHQRAPTVGGGLAFDAYGGAINRVASHDSAFVHRNKLAGIQASYSWSLDAPASVVAAGHEWLVWLGDHVFDARTGAYQNYIDPSLADWPTAYYGTNLARLADIKRRYDPDNLFSFAQSIPLSH